jgi:hypothetical protein
MTDQERDERNKVIFGMLGKVRLQPHQIAEDHKDLYVRLGLIEPAKSMEINHGG